jgi:hypothetical protein
MPNVSLGDTCCHSRKSLGVLLNASLNDDEEIAIRNDIDKTH